MLLLLGYNGFPPPNLHDGGFRALQKLAISLITHHGYFPDRLFPSFIVGKEGKKKRWIRGGRIIDQGSPHGEDMKKKKKKKGKRTRTEKSNLRNSREQLISTLLKKYLLGSLKSWYIEGTERRADVEIVCIYLLKIL